MAPAHLPIATLDQIIHADDLAREEVDVPEWGCSFRLRGVTLDEHRGAVSAASKDDGSFDGRDFALRILIAGCEEPELDEQAVGVLATKAFKVVDGLIETVYRLSKIGAQEVDNAEAGFPQGPAATLDDAVGEEPRPDVEGAQDGD